MRVKSVQDLPVAMRAQAEAQIVKGSYPVQVARAHRIDLYAPPSEAKRGNKFGAQRVEAHGIKFDSKWEAQRYTELLMMERADLIRDLSVHIPFALEVRDPGGNMIRIGAYVADFVFWRTETQQIVEDAKSLATRKLPLFVWKRSHFEMQYGLRITEVERNKPRLGADT